MSGLDDARAGRVAGSLEPALFDTIEYVYPDDVTVIEIYSYIGGDGTEEKRYVTGVVKYTYTDASHLRPLKVWRDTDV